MSLVKTVRQNSAYDMLRFGYVLFEFKVDKRRWQGYDVDGTSYIVTNDTFGFLPWVDAECDHRWYRCIQANVLKESRHPQVKSRPVFDSRNAAWLP